MDVFNTERCVGTGAKGQIFLGFDKSSGRQVAIKRLHFTTTTTGSAVFGHEEDRSVLDSITNEIQLMEKARHENIVSYYGCSVDRTTGVVEIWMEYVSGGSLGRVIRSFGPLRDAVVRSYGRDILRGLAYLHDIAKTAHRDIKPENILLHSNGQCKVADFGASKSLSASCGISVVSTKIGTPNYIAPEVLTQDDAAEGGSSDEGVDRLTTQTRKPRPRHGYDPFPADVWSFGATLYEMTTGKRPYEAISNPMAVMFRIAQEGRLPALPTSCNPLLVDVIQQCCQAEPQKRPRASALLDHPFFTEDLLHRSPPSEAPNLPVRSPNPVTTKDAPPPATLDHLAGAAAPLVELLPASIAAGASAPIHPLEQSQSHSAPVAPPSQAESAAAPHGSSVGGAHGLLGSSTLSHREPPQSAAAQPTTTAATDTQQQQEFPFFAQKVEPIEPRRLCQVCGTSLAVFSCDRCSELQLPSRLCHECWSPSHSQQRFKAIHQKKPLLVVTAVPLVEGGGNAPTSSSSASSPPPQSQAVRLTPAPIQGVLSGGFVTADGAYVELSTGGTEGRRHSRGQPKYTYRAEEQSEWNCGRCATLNDGPAVKCVICGHKR